MITIENLNVLPFHLCVCQLRGATLTLWCLLHQRINLPYTKSILQLGALKSRHPPTPLPHRFSPRTTCFPSRIAACVNAFDSYNPILYSKAITTQRDPHVRICPCQHNTPAKLPVSIRTDGCSHQLPVFQDITHNSQRERQADKQSCNNIQPQFSVR